MREREPSGISLQEYRSEMQMSLLSTSQAETEQASRCLKYRYGRLAGYEWEGEEPLANVVRNQKYSIVTFVPMVLYQQFQYFFNLFYLLTALSQFVPILKVGLLFSFVAPLVLVLLLTMLKEAYEDFQRYKKDKELNSAIYM
jgi:magnesium-transporting ATPase (P-type)